MTKPDFSDANLPSDGAVLLKRGLLGVGGGITLVFIAGMIAGYGSVVIEHGGPSLIDAAIIAAMLMAAVALGYGIWRFWPRGRDEPEAPRVKSARIILVAVCIVSAVIGIILAVEDEGASSLFSNAPINPAMGMLVLVLWLVSVPVLTWLWWRKVDEHEAGAHRDGAAIAAHAYMFIAPAWWIASRAGWLPNQEPMIVLLIVSAVWCVVWFIKRYL